MTDTKSDLTQTIVEESGKGKFSQTVSTGGHTLNADEPVANGGNDLGPSPYDFLLTALGTCTSMTLRMYADFKKIPLKKITVRLTHEKTYAKDCENCENENARIDHLDREIELEGDLTEDQRQKLLEIANKCPVHRTLTSKILITTELKK
jgi:putative redox protein